MFKRLGISKSFVTNGAEFRRDLDLYDLECLDLLAVWMDAFDINYTLWDEVMRLDSKGIDIMFYVRTVGEIIVLTEWVGKKC